MTTHKLQLYSKNESENIIIYFDASLLNTIYNLQYMLFKFNFSFHIMIRKKIVIGHLRKPLLAITSAWLSFKMIPEKKEGKQTPFEYD